MASRAGFYRARVALVRGVFLTVALGLLLGVLAAAGALVWSGLSSKLLRVLHLPMVSPVVCFEAAAGVVAGLGLLLSVWSSVRAWALPPGGTSRGGRQIEVQRFDREAWQR